LIRACLGVGSMTKFMSEAGNAALNPHLPQTHTLTYTHTEAHTHTHTHRLNRCPYSLPLCQAFSRPLFA